MAPSRPTENEVLVLVVDDDDQMRAVIYHAVKNAGYACLVAKNGQDALLYVDRNPVDVVIADIIMPGMNGMVLLEKIKAVSNANVIMVTGHLEVYSFEEVIDKGADDFLQKPINSRELTLRLKRVLKMRAMLAEKDKVENTLKHREMQLRRVGLRTGKIEEALRKKFALELHDRIGQNLTALNLNLTALKDSVNQTDIQVSRKIIADSMQLLTDTFSDVRDIMAKLRPVGLDDYGLAGAVGWYVERFKQRTGIEVETDMAAYTTRLPLWHETIIFRVTQEAFTNIAKHSKATRVKVAIAQTESEVVYRISDNGIGFDMEQFRVPGENAGWGLLSMKERTKSNNAHFALHSEVGKGTTITITVRPMG